MDRTRSRPPLGGLSVPVGRPAALQLLLRAGSYKRREPVADEESRRTVHRKTLSWVSHNYRASAKGGVPGQPQESSRDYETPWDRGTAAWAQHLKGAPGASQVPLPLERACHLQTPAGMEYGYHVYPPARRLHLSNGSHRLAQSAGTLAPTLEQLGHDFLPGSIRRGCCQIRLSRDFQYRSGSPIHFRGICSSSAWEGHPVQHGWARTGSGQYFCRTPLEIGKI